MAVPKRAFDFGNNIPVGATQSIVLADQVELLHWRELTMIVRVHSHSLTGSNSISVTAWPQSTTPEDPNIVWLTSDKSNSVFIQASTPIPSMLTADLVTIGTDNDPYTVANMVQILVQPFRAGVGSMQATISVEISAKEV
jgi:hypothetical protein